MSEHQANVRLNEIWAGTPVNMAAKLASLSGNNEILISERYYNRIHAGLAQCLCKDYDTDKIWRKENCSKNKSFDFNTAFGSSIKWCKDHGATNCGQLLALDKEK